MKKLKDKLRCKSTRITVHEILAVLVIFQPSMFMLVLREQFRLQGLGNTFGSVIFGAFLGCLLFYILKKLNIIKISMLRNATGRLFLAIPYVFYGLVLLHHGFNVSFFWLFFGIVYVIFATKLYVESNVQNPQNTLNNTEFYVSAAAVMLLLIVIIVEFINRGVSYTNDSFSYFDISQNIFRDFGLVSTIRQFRTFSYYSTSFPYLFPAIIAVVDNLTGFGIYSGNLINLIVLFACLYFLIKISVKVAKSNYPGIIATAIIITEPQFWEEMTAARAVPLSILCVLIIISILVDSEIFGIVQVKKSPSNFPRKIKDWISQKNLFRDLFFMGVFAGAGMTIRFDFIVISGLLGIILVLIFAIKRRIFSTIPFYVLGLLVCATPWIIFSWLHFGNIWISDNSSTWALISPVSPNRFFYADEIVPSIFNDTRGWLASRQAIFIDRFSDFIQLLTRPISIFVIFGIVNLEIFSNFCKNLLREKSQINSNFKLMFLGILIIYSVKSILIFLIGFADLRYHVETVVIILFLTLCHYFQNFRNDFLQAKMRVWSAFVGIIVFVLLLTIQPTINSMKERLALPLVQMDKILLSEEGRDLERQILQYSAATNPRDIRLWMFTPFPNTEMFEFGAYTDFITFFPAFATEQAFFYLLENFINPNYIFDSSLADGTFNKWVRLLSRDFLLNRIGESFAFSVTPLDNFSEIGVVVLADLTDNNWISGVHRSEQILLFDNNERNRNLLKNAVGLRTDNFSVEVVKVVENGEFLWVITGIAVDLHGDSDKFLVLE
ncbi:MAG: hypothetical protein FWG64_06420 [Firmicutes bacterium]|nr:hypothetical protein [Bacillota bacterium]